MATYTMHGTDISNLTPKEREQLAEQVAVKVAELLFKNAGISSAIDPRKRKRPKEIVMDETTLKAALALTAEIALKGGTL